MGRAEDLFRRIEDQGLQAIQALIKESKSEESFLDFKRSGDQGKGSQLHDDDRKNLSRALSGFANADGGVLIWGVGTSPAAKGDLASTLFPLIDCAAFAARVDDKVSWGTTPPVMGVRSVPITLEDGTGFVATLIPASEIGPHCATEGTKYFVRSGSSFGSVSHTVLAGMFGRRPQSKIRAACTMQSAKRYWDREIEHIDIQFEVHVFNDTAVVARDAYVSIDMPKTGSETSTLFYGDAQEDRWQMDLAAIHKGASFLARESNRVAPFSSQHVIHMGVRLKLPFTSDLKITFLSGCDGSPPIHMDWFASRAHLQAVLQDIEQVEPGRIPVRVDLDIAQKLLGWLVQLT